MSIPTAREKFRTFLVRKGLRATNQRLAIFDAAFTQPEHFTAERALRREVDIGSGEKFYHPNREGDGTQVAQVVCVDCDKIFEISAPFMAWYGNTVSSKLGLTPVTQRLQVSAHCNAFRQTGTCPRRG